MSMFQALSLNSSCMPGAPTCPSLTPSLSHELPSLLGAAMIGQALKRGAAALEVEAKVAKQPKGGSKGGGKGGRGKDKEKDSKSSGSKMDAGSEDGKLQILILKTLLKHSQQHRDAESVLFLTYLAPTSSFPILSAR